MLTHHRPVQWGWKGNLHCHTACLWLLCGWVMLPLSHHGGPWLRNKRSRAGFPGPSCRRSHSPQSPVQQNYKNWYFNILFLQKNHHFSRKFTTTDVLKWQCMVMTCAHLWHRETHPEQLFRQLQQSSRKDQNKVCSVANLLLLHVWGHHQHLCCWVLHLQTTTTTTALIIGLRIAHFQTDILFRVKSWQFPTSSSLRMVAASLVTNSFSKWLITILFIPAMQQSRVWMWRQKNSWTRKAFSETKVFTIWPIGCSCSLRKLLARSDIPENCLLKTRIVLQKTTFHWKVPTISNTHHDVQHYSNV